VTALFNRLGNLGVLLVASALLVGGLGGAAIAHHFESLSAKTVASQQLEDQDRGKQAKKKSNKSSQNGKQKQHQAQRQENQGDNQTGA
jgi:ABC-type nickel/cobalt efflux system permease component RcnA